MSMNKTGKQILILAGAIASSFGIFENIVKESIRLSAEQEKRMILAQSAGMTIEVYEAFEVANNILPSLDFPGLERLLDDDTKT